ncbi:SERF2 factor, partial [Atractosteus spatula]|nr:SERF2 factor [Atractosteus spatula]
GNQRELARQKNAKKQNEQSRGKRNEDGLSAAARKQRYAAVSLPHTRVQYMCPLILGLNLFGLQCSRLLSTGSQPGPGDTNHHVCPSSFQLSSSYITTATCLACRVLVYVFQHAVPSFRNNLLQAYPYSQAISPQVSLFITKQLPLS